LYEGFWGDTHDAWMKAGKMAEGESFGDHFGFDIELSWPFALVLDQDFEPRAVSETDETIVWLDGNGATLRRHKLHDTTPEHVDFKVKEREQWDQVKHMLAPDERRINFEAYRDLKRKAAEAGRFFMWSGVNAFECIHPVCGHENMLVGMALDPDWVLDMSMSYARVTVELQKILFEREGLPDGIWFYEDMGFKAKPFMSPDMYARLIKPAHDLTFGYAKSLGLPVTVHSCGFVEPLVPGLIDAGMDCLQVIEVKAGMDLLKLHREFGDRIAFMGGLDVRALYTNDRAVIDAELEAKIPIVKQGFNYIVHSDHSIPNTVEYDTYRYFVDRALELGTY
jgi:uroporphyrinogen decarboxylase